MTTVILDLIRLDLSRQRLFAVFECFTVPLPVSLTCLLLQQAARGGPVTVASISHLPGYIHGGEPRQGLQVPREVLHSQLGGVGGQESSGEDGGGGDFQS